MPLRTILVLGATGTQGHAVARALLAAGHAVRALVRDPETAGARRLAAAGVTLARGDYDHPDTLYAAADGIDAAFVNTSPFVPGVGVAGEVRQGRAIVDAMARAGVAHVVYSSVSDADRATGVPHFDSKWAVEQILAESGLTHTVTAPVYFIENLTSSWSLPALRNGILRVPMPRDRPLQMVSVHDIGAFNAALLAQEPPTAARRINYAGDSLSMTEVARILTEATSRPVRFERQPMSEIEAFSDDTARMFRWFVDVGYSADITALRSAFPSVGWQDVRTWALAQPWSDLLAPGGAA